MILAEGKLTHRTIGVLCCFAGIIFHPHIPVEEVPLLSWLRERYISAVLLPNSAAGWQEGFLCH